MDLKPTVPELSDDPTLENPPDIIPILEGTPDVIPSLDNVIPSLETPPVENTPEIKQGLENMGELTSMDNTNSVLDQGPELLEMYNDQQSEIKHRSTQPLSDSTSPV